MSKVLRILKLPASYLRTTYRHWKTDAYVISFPKSGRTWLRLLIGKTLCEKFNLPSDIMLDTYRVTAAAGTLRTQLTHDHSSMNEGARYFELPTDKKNTLTKR